MCESTPTAGNWTFSTTKRTGPTQEFFAAIFLCHRSPKCEVTTLSGRSIQSLASTKTRI
eukprot:COSAG01_NODE_32873_length_573_cov_66.405063_1_plen_58_part_10